MEAENNQTHWERYRELDQDRKRKPETERERELIQKDEIETHRKKEGERKGWKESS